MKNIFFLIIGFYLLTLLQASFFPHLSVGFIPIFSGGLNLVLIIVVLINLFESRKERIGFLSAFFGGFFLDIFSENFFGFWVLILLAIAILIKFVLKTYVRLPIFKRA